ncbi:hypothetical protein FDP41_010960 [Naegleria fowleri]|uniref:Calcium-regulated actin-bundling protein C-terminal domain-containing protein n=1 Tax=Naegleria fowleri TaxID=5763 RepID=A0A6A5C7V3_NAEFO|nr:uncharacterized protein FDP41_010960 [Naegleria fowleri]KAF0982982.1 hypothetical protein FDP41_010960 [Naegleria fowleri]CAG4713753.1 unnamed protein product [Naegleria fowleri]
MPQVDPKHAQRFQELVNQPIDEQCEFFLKSFIFALGDDWPEVVKLSNAFKKYISENTSSAFQGQLDEAQAADFLQKNGRTRTATQRREEIRDIDLDFNKHIAFIEYLLLHYKHMILQEYYKRHTELTAPKDHLENFAIGVTGVGYALLEELFTMPEGMNEELEKAISEFYAAKRERENKIKDLESKSHGEGVGALRAKNELAQMQAQDQTETNKMEMTLNAAKRKALKHSGSEALAQKKKQQEEEEKKKLMEGRQKMKEKSALWEQK